MGLCPDPLFRSCPTHPPMLGHCPHPKSCPHSRGNPHPMTGQCGGTDAQPPCLSLEQFKESSQLRPTPPLYDQLRRPHLQPQGRRAASSAQSCLLSPLNVDLLRVSPRKLLHPVAHLRVYFQGTQSMPRKDYKSSSLHMTPPLPPTPYTRTRTWIRSHVYT